MVWSTGESVGGDMWERGTRVESLLGFDVCSCGRGYLCVICKITRCTIAVVEVFRENYSRQSTIFCWPFNNVWVWGRYAHIVWVLACENDEAGVSGNSRFPWFPGIQASNFPSLPVAFCNFPSRSREKEFFGRELRREILSLFAVWRMAGQGMKINEMLNLTLPFIWFPGIPGITSLKFPIPFPSRSIF